MIPIELELKNFLAYRDPGVLNLEGLHVVCLAGPNGAGKSSLLDAITWALWGKARSNSSDALMHQVQQTSEQGGRREMRVALLFEQQGARYRVIRLREAGKRAASVLDFQVWDDSAGSWRGLGARTLRETQARINDLLRLDYETFINSAFLLQGRADEFTTKTPGQRKQVLANILGLSVWEQYEARAKQSSEASKAALQRIDGRLEEIDRELAREAEIKAEMEAAKQQAEEAAQALEAAEAQWADLEETRADMISLQRQIDDLTRRITATAREIAEAQSERQAAEGRADRSAIEAALKTVRASLEALLPLEDELKRTSDVLARDRERIAELKGANQALKPQTEPVKERLEILKAASDPICPTCGQPLTEDHRHELIEQLEQEVEARREIFRVNRESIQKLEEQVAARSRAQAELEAKLTERPGLQKKAAELEAALKQSDQAAKQAASLAERIKRWQAEMAGDQQRRAELETRIEESERRLRAASITQQDLDRLRLAKRMADERVGGARQQLAALESHREQRAQLTQERRQVAQDIADFEELRRAFSKRGVPAMIIETAVPELERNANDLLQRLTESGMNVRIETQREIKSGDLREALDIIISDELGSRPYELYSGGEAFRINFAIRIALSKLLARRAGAQLRSLFIDEGFGTQDARGREHVVAAINGIQDDFDLIVVITHIEELKEAFPARIEVEKTAQGSTYRLT